VLIILYRYNKRKKKCARDVNLSGRYQYAENVATLVVLVPSVLIWGVVLFFAEMTEPFFYVAWRQGDRETQVFISQFIYLLAALNSIVCPLAFVLKYGPLNNALRYDLQRLCFWRSFRLRTHSNVYAEGGEGEQPHPMSSHVSMEQKHARALEVTDRHFRQLHDTWWK
ncbi:hypothetical protein AAVH_21538, partial [Aphelenchoides avenae]